MGDIADESERLDEQAVASIRAGLARVLSSDVFSAAPQLSAFLSFVVERAIEGRRAELKGYTIAVEALGRSADFDPQADPIVRVEAGRLRRALTQYYAGKGHDDPVRMTMPVGGYVPVFAFSEAAEDVEAEPLPAPESAAGESTGAQAAAAGDAIARRWSLAALLVLACALLALLVWYLEPFGDQAPQAGLASQSGLAADAAIQSAQERPAPPAQLVSVAIVIPQVPSDPKLADALRRVSEVLVDVVARFDDLFVIKAPPAGAPPPEGVDYVFEISIVSTEGALEGFGRLRSAKDGRIVWTASSSRPVGELLQDQDLADLARRVGMRLAEPFGIIHADFRQNSSSPAMQCIFQAFDYRRFMTPEKQAAARACLEQLVGRDPEFYPAWAQFALLLASEYASGADDSNRGVLLDRALSAALTAMRLAPSGARAQQAMMNVLFLRGSVADAIRTGREALNRNPYDPDIMADLGSLYVRLNRPAEGLPLLERAVEISAGRPPWYDFYAFLGAYLSGAKRLSETYSAVLEADTTPFSLLGQALQANAGGDAARRDAALRELAGQVPLFATDPYLYLTRKGFREEVTQRILGDLGIAAR